jgi:hypothetical protein
LLTSKSVIWNRLKTNEKGVFMKKVILLCSLVLGLIGIMAFNAAAIPINGDISFAGGTTLDNTNLTLATQFLSFFDVKVTSVSGDYAGLAGTAVTFTPFVFSPPAPAVTPLWTFDILTTTYSFDATSVAVQFASPTALVVEGVGTGHITGLDDTPGTWTITANSGITTFSFSASTVVEPVPEPATLLLIGSGLLGLVGLRRKFKK